MSTPYNPIPTGSPYVGLRPYRVNEALFFGHQQEIQELGELLIEQKVVLFYAPTGTGKTSLVQAGLIPAMQQQGYPTLAVIRVGLAHLTGMASAPVDEEPPNEWYAEEPDNRESGHPTTRPPWLAAVKPNPYRMSTIICLEESLPVDLRMAPTRLANFTLESYLQHYLEISAASRLPGERGQMLVFDQFEELFWLDPSDRDLKEVFIQELGQTLDNYGFLAVIVLQEEFVARMDRYLGYLAGLSGKRYRLPLLDPVSALAAIEEPIKRFTPPVVINEAASREIIQYLRLKRVPLADGSWRDVTDQPIEPLQLQAICQRVWLKRQSENEIGVSDFRLVCSSTQADADNSHPDPVTLKSGVEPASYAEIDQGAYYAEFVAVAAQRSNLPERQIRHWFEHTMITPQGKRTLVKEERQRAGDLDLRAIRALMEAGLVVSLTRGGQTWFELAHEGLIPVVRQNNAWWQQNRQSLLQRQAAVWDREGRPEYLLLRGQSLREQERWAQDHPDQMSILDLAYLQACMKQREHDSQEQSQVQQQARYTSQTSGTTARAVQATRSLLIIVAVLAGVAILAGIAAYGFGRFALDKYEQANKEAALAIGLMKTAEPVAATANLASTMVAQQLGTAQAVEAGVVQKLQQAEDLSNQASQDLLEASSARATAEASLALASRTDSEAKTALAAAEQGAASNRQALSRQLATNSFGLFVEQPDVAAVLAVEAYCSADTGLARSALLTLLQAEMQNPIALIPPEFDAGSSVRSLIYSPTGRLIAWGADSPPVVWRNLETNEAFQDPVDVRAARVFALAFSPDERFLASGGYDGFIVLRSMSDGTYRKTQKFTQLIHSLDFNLKGQLAAALGEQVLLWDVEEFWNATPNVPQEVILEHDGDIYSLDWDPSGERLATGSQDQTVRITDPARNTVVNMIQVHTKAVRDVTWSKDGKMLASAGDDGQIVLWDPVNGMPLGEPMLERNRLPVFSVSFSPDGRLLATGGVNDEVVLWDIATRTPVNVLEDYFQDNVTGVAFSPLVQGGKYHLLAGSASGQVALFEVSMEQKLVEKLPPAPPGGLVALAVDGNGGLSGVVTNESGAQVIGLPPGGAWEPLSPGYEPVSTAAISLDAASVALAPVPSEAGDVYARVLRSSDWTETARLDFPLAGESTSPLYGLAFDATAAHLAGSQCVLTDPGEQTCIPDRNQLQIVSTTNSTPQQKMAVGENQPRLLAYDPLGRYLASGGVSSGVQIWELALDGQALTDEGPVKELYIEQPITALAFSRDGRLLAVGLEDWTLELWDTQDWERIGYPQLGSPARITSLAFDPFGEWLYAAYADGSVQRVQVDPNTWAEQVCQLTDRTLSSKEWSLYFGSPEGVPACERLAECK